MYGGSSGRGRGRGAGGSRGGGRGRGSYTCYHCGKPGHIARDCRDNPSSSSFFSSPSSSSSSSSPSSSSSSSSSLSPYIDTHVHVEYILQKTHKGSVGEIKSSFRYPANYEGCISIFCDPGALSPSFGLWQDLLNGPDNVYGAFGIHPHHANYYTDQVEERIKECLKHPRAVAWGECGLDFYKDISKREAQMEAFARQIQCAVSLKKPLVIHSRAAEEETLDLLRKHLPKEHPTHLHCFNDGVVYAKKILEEFSNVFFGITGVITFADSDRLRGIVRDILPLDRILLETDSPYLAPKDSYSKVNHSGNIPAIAKCIADLKAVSLDEVYTITRFNTNRCFSI